MELVLTFAALVLAGLLIGIVCGLLGVGGGTVMVPALRLVFGLSAYAATATSLFTMVFTSVSGAVAHLRNKTCIPALGAALGLGGCVTSAAGVYLASLSPPWAIMLVAALIIVYTGFNMARKALALPRRSTAAPVAADAPSAEDDGAGAYEMTRVRAFGGFAVGMLAGLAAGYVGVGGGFVMVPLMTMWLSVPMKKASGTSLVAILILAVPGIVEQAFFGNIDYVAGLALAAGSIPGAAIGARFVRTIPERGLCLAFAAFLALAAVLLVCNEALS